MARLKASRWRRRVIGFAIAVGLPSFIVVAQPLWAYGLLATLLPEIIWRVETTEPLVALSFDDGPDPTFTPRVLDVLARHGARA